MKQTILSEKQSNLLENLIVKYGQIVTSSQIIKEAEVYWDYSEAKNLIVKLAKNGWLIRIKRGLYVISDLSSRGFLTLSPYVVANLLVSDSYVSFESALQQYGMFDQMTNKTVSVSLKESKSYVVADMEYRFIKAKPELYFGWEDVRIGNADAKVATPEKALIDMVNFHKNQYSIDLAIEKLIDYKTELNWTRFYEYLWHYSNTTKRTFGLIFDFINIDSEKLYQTAKDKTGAYSMLKGDDKFNAKWRLYYNSYFDKYKTK